MTHSKNLDMVCRHTIQKYRCPRCERNYTSLDIASFPIREFGFQCGECNDEGYDVSLHESFHSQDGAMIDVKEKDQRVAAAKAMLVIQAAVCFILQQDSSGFCASHHITSITLSPRISCVGNRYALT